MSKTAAELLSKMREHDRSMMELRERLALEISLPTTSELIKWLAEKYPTAPSVQLETRTEQTNRDKLSDKPGVEPSEKP